MQQMNSINNKLIHIIKITQTQHRCLSMDSTLPQTLQQSEIKQSEVQTYFNNYMKSSQKLASPDKNKISVDSVQQIGSKIQQQIDKGNIAIKEKSVKETDQISQDKRSLISSRSIRDLSKQIHEKKEKLNKELILLNMSLRRSSNSNRSRLHQSKQSQSGMPKRSRTQITDEDLTLYQQRRQNSEIKLRSLKSAKKFLQVQKQQSIKLKQLRNRQLESIKKDLQQKVLQQLKQQKIDRISSRLQKLEEKRAERVNILKNSYVKSAGTLPRYKIMRYRFDSKQIQYQNQQRQQFKRQSMHKKYSNSSESIKKHQIMYNKSAKQAKKSNSQSRVSTLTTEQLQKLEKQYNKPHENPQRFEKSQEKCLRIKQFQEIINHKREQMVMDPVIGIQIQAAKDKAKYPFKYHYLNIKKNLTDVQIYQNHSNFNFNSDPILVGNLYLEQIKLKNKSAVLNKSQTRRIKTDISTANSNKIATDRKIYTNYIQESLKKAASKDKKDEIQQLLKQHGEKSKVLEILQSKAQSHLVNSMKKIQKLTNTNSYTYNKTLTMQKEIDEEFINSIKAKLKCFQVQ